MWELRRLCAVSAGLAEGTPERTVFAANRVWDARQPAVRSMLKRCDGRRLNALLVEGAAIDRALKGAARGNPWDLLEALLFRMAGVDAGAAGVA
jgi:DNA polymerase-3 subunit delta